MADFVFYINPWREPHSEVRHLVVPMADTPGYPASKYESSHRMIKLPHLPLVLIVVVQWWHAS